MRAWHTYDDAMSDLSALPPGERLQALISEWTGEAELLYAEDIRKLFVYAWPDGRGSVDDTSDGLLKMLHWIAPVRDIETYLVGTLTVFRAAGDHRGIRWTLDEAAAAAEVQDGIVLFRASLAASDVLGHFTGDGRDEVLVDPRRLSSIEPVAGA